jgi:thiamine pyrophosphokinase
VHTVIVAGSALETPLDAEVVRAADLVVAADGGAEALLAVGRPPDLVVGDMDSISKDSLALLTDLGVEQALLPTAKDETDLEAALKVVVGRGASSVTILGALGGPRLDHLVGTILLLGATWLDDVSVRVLDHWHELFLSRGEAEVRGRPGDTVSLLALTPRVERVRTEGLVYALRDESLEQGTTRGVSNELAGERATVTHGSGRLLVIHYRRERKPHVHFDHDESVGKSPPPAEARRVEPRRVRGDAGADRLRGKGEIDGD